MPIFSDLSDAKGIAEYYTKRVGVAEFKGIRDEAERNNPRTPLWNKGPLIQRGIQRGANGEADPIKINFLTAPVIDTVRVAKSLSGPKGLLFLASQVGGGLTNPKGEWLGSPIHPGRIFNPVSLALQPLANIAGVHLDVWGAGPLNLVDLNYEKRSKAINNELEGKQNRLVRLGGELGVGYLEKHKPLPKDAKVKFEKIGQVLDKFASRFGKENKPIKLLSGIGGPHSLYGIGRSTIRRSTMTTIPIEIGQFYFPEEGKHYKDLNPEGVLKDIVESATFDYKSRVNAPPAEGESGFGVVNYKTLDFGGITRIGKNLNKARPLKTFKDGTGDSAKFDVTDTLSGGYGIPDYGSDPDALDPITNPEDNLPVDLINFAINGYKFRAIGLGSMTDDTSFGWNEVTYVGRTAPSYAFDKVTRTIGHDLIIPSFTPAEARNNYKKLNLLYKSCSPSVDENGLATAPISTFTLGDLYKSVKVAVEKITFSIEEDYSWDYGIDDDLSSGLQIPMVIKLNLSYKFLTNADGNLFTSGANFFGENIANL